MSSRSTKLSLILVAFALFAASCGGDSSGDASGEASSEASVASEAPGGDAAPNNDEAASTAAPQPAAEPSAAAPDGISDGTAVISLANGEVFEFGVLCALLPQPNFEYTIVSYDDPANLDISKWSEDAQFSGTNVSIYDSTTYDTLWEASTTFELQGGDLELTVSGSTVSGSGTFWPEGDSFQEGVQGDIMVNC